MVLISGVSNWRRSDNGKRNCGVMKKTDRGNFRRRERPNFVRRRNGRDRLGYRLLKNRPSGNAKPKRRRRGDAGMRKRGDVERRTKGGNKRGGDLKRKEDGRKRRSADEEMKRGGNWRRRGEN